MITYLDTSSFVPLLLQEKTTRDCELVWARATTVATTRLLYVETISSLQRANRDGRLSDRTTGPVIRRLDSYWREFRLVELDTRLTERAGEIAWQFGLRGYDAVHCAAACLLHEANSETGMAGDFDFVAVSGDRKLAAVWRELGIATFEPSV